MDNKGGRLHFSITADNEDIKRKLAESRQALLNSGKTAEEQGAKIEGMFKRAALAAGAFFTAQQAISFARQIAVVRGEFQQLEVAFTTMLGSASRGKAMMQEAVDIASKTPFDLKGVAQGAKQLLAYGSASQDVGKELVMLGNIASGLSIPLNDMVYLYGTTQTQGRLFTQDLRQFMGRGIPLADELAKQFGVTKERVGELVTAGKVGFPEVQKALQAMTADGGKFNNLMAEQSKTITGQISNLGDSIDVMFNKIGRSNEGVISGAIGGATSLIENYEAVGREIGALVVAYGAYKAALITVSATQGVVTNVRYATEIAELTKLLPIKKASADADIHAAVASGRLTLSKGEELIAMRAEVTAKLESLRLTAQQAVAEKALATTTHKATLERALASKAMVAQREMELSLAKLSGSASQIELAQKSLLEAQEQRHIAVKARKATADTLAITNSRVISTTTAVETMQNGLNTISQRVETTSTGFLAVAKAKLTAITAKLNAVVMANPYTIAAVAVAALAYVIYKLCTAQSAAERAQERFNEKLEENKKKQDEFISKTNELIGVIRSETNTRYMQTKAFKELNEMYPEVLKNMTLEQILLMDNLKLQRLFNEARDKKEQKDSADSLEKAQQAYDKAKDEYDKKFMNTGDGSGIKYQEDLEAAESNLNGWKKITEKQKKIIEESKPAEVKIFDLKQNITTLKSQLDEIDGLLHSSGRKPTEIELFKIDGLNKELSEAQAKLKTLNSIQNTSTYAEDYKTAKADWEQKKKVLIEIEKDKTKFTTKAYEDAKNAEDEAKKKYSSLGGDTSEKKPDKDPDWKKLQEAKISAENKYREAQVTNRFDTQQILIDMMEEGGEKELAQIDLNYKQKEEAIKKWEKEQRQLIIDAQKAAYTAKNGSDKGFKVNESDVAFKFIGNSVDLKNRANNKDKATEQAEGLNKMLADYQNYFEKVKKIDEKYSKDRAKLEEENKKRGGNDEEILRAIAVLDEKQKEEQAATDLYYAQKQDSFLAWTNSIADFGIEQLKSELKTAEKELNKLGGSKDDKKVSAAKAKVTTLEKQINKENAKTDTAPKKRDFKEWQKLQKTLNGVAGSFKEIGEEIGGMAGESIETVGVLSVNILSMIDGILTFSTTGIFAVEKTSSAATKALKTVESASVILAIISAALQVAMKIAELFSKDRELSEETIESYEVFMDVTDDLIDQQKELLDTLTGVQAVMASDEALKVIEKQVEATRALGKEYLASAAKNKHTYGKKTWGRLNDNRNELESIGIDFNKLKGSGRAEGLFDLPIEQLNDFRYELPKVWAELDEETRKYLEDIMGSEEKMQEVIEMRNEALTGMSLDDARSELLDFLNDTEMTMENVAENFEESMKNAINRIIANKTLSKGLEDWYTNFTKAMEDGTLTEIEKAQLQQEYEGAYKKATSEKDAAYVAAGIKTTTPADEQSATSKGFETISQETASKLDGSFLSLRITAIDIKNQGLDKIKYLSKMDVNLGQVLTVSSETKFLVEEMRNIQKDSFLELQGINKNTKNTTTILTAMAGDIKIMKDKL